MTASAGEIYVVLFVLAASLFGVSRLCARAYRRRYPPLGKMVQAENGVSLHIIDRTGPGNLELPPVVLIHGASGNARDQDGALGVELSQTTRVLSVDRPGLGWSGRGSLEKSGAPDEQARLIVSTFAALGINEAVIVGHSLGASVACALALYHPDHVAGVVLLAPATHPWPGSGGISWHNRVAAMPYIGALFSALFPPILGGLLMPLVLPSVFTPNEVPDRYAERAGAALALTPSSFRANAIDVVGLKSHVARLSRRYGDIKAPMLVIAGGADKIVSNVIHAEAVAHAVPDARFVALEGIGHMIQWSARDEVLRHIIEFARALEQRSARRPVQAGA